MSATAKRVPSDETIGRLARGLQLPRELVEDAAADAAGIRIYEEAVTDPDTKVVIATMEKLTPHVAGPSAGWSRR